MSTQSAPVETAGRHVIEAVAEELELEDGGRAAIVHVAPPGDSGWFIKVQSWQEHTPGKAAVRAQPENYHPVPAEIAGRRVRITVEVIEP